MQISIDTHQAIDIDTVNICIYNILVYSSIILYIIYSKISEYFHANIWHTV